MARVRTYKVDLRPDPSLPVSLFDPKWNDPEVAARVALDAYRRASLDNEEMPPLARSGLPEQKRTASDIRSFSLDFVHEHGGARMKGGSYGELHKKYSYGGRRPTVNFHAQAVCFGADSEGRYFLRARVGRFDGAWGNDAVLSVTFFAGDDEVGAAFWRGDLDPPHDVDIEVVGLDAELKDRFEELTGARVAFTGNHHGTGDEMTRAGDFVATDLHGHSLFSDALASPEDFVRFRAERRFEVIALSDHDTFAGVPRARAAADQHGLTLVPAMETTSFIHFGTERAEQIHVLAYFPPSTLDDGRLEQTFLYQRSWKVHERWRAFHLAWLRGLSDDEQAALGVDELEACSPLEFPGLQVLIQRIVERRRELYPAFHRHHVRFWTEDRALFGWGPEEMIDQIRADGALDVVAHPVRVRDKERMDRVLDYASGLEAYTSRHRADIAERFRAYAEERGKHWTASSDDHQQGVYLRPPVGTPRRTVERILAGA